MFSTTPVHRRGNYLDTLCATLEDKMMYAKGERDMVMLQHKFEVELKDGTKVKKKNVMGIIVQNPIPFLPQPP